MLVLTIAFFAVGAYGPGFFSLAATVLLLVILIREYRTAFAD
jgi:hypothetical protein